LNVATLTIEGEYCSLATERRTTMVAYVGFRRATEVPVEVEIMTGSAAESLLAIFEDIQRMHQQDRQALIQELDALGPPQT
jgi:hypothetical protein